MEKGIAALKTVREVLFQTLVLDGVKLEAGQLCAEFHSVYLLN